ncbi:uncharacterized protein LOC107264408 [Cephus cinctus]|uniref:Uncharacterized protein LOC107264408 n=1 Tax=Cephus cinctus TaxID=211228 RepID=A0AAJ7FEQ3_CEPCN|nr:uncharacterized protein LOC107264408 [Cephus cinctus]
MGVPFWCKNYHRSSHGLGVEDQRFNTCSCIVGGTEEPVIIEVEFRCELVNSWERSLTMKRMQEYLNQYIMGAGRESSFPLHLLPSFYSLSPTASASSSLLFFLFRSVSMARPGSEHPPSWCTVLQFFATAVFQISPRNPSGTLIIPTIHPTVSPASLPSDSMKSIIQDCPSIRCTIVNDHRLVLQQPLNFTE